jgi:hypothetical protein
LTIAIPRITNRNQTPKKEQQNNANWQKNGQGVAGNRIYDDLFEKNRGSLLLQRV